MEFSQEIVTEVYSHEMHALFEKFESLVGSRYWQKRRQKIEDEIRGNSFLRQLLLRQNRVAFILNSFSSLLRASGGLVLPSPLSYEQYEACVLVAQFSNLYSIANDKGKHALQRRMQAAFQNPDDLRAMQFEWHMATHLTKRGFLVSFPEQTREGNFDLLAVKGNIQFEVECKSTSEDSGKQLPAREVCEFQKLLSDATKPYSKTLKKGLWVRIVFKKRIPHSHSERKALCAAVRSSIILATPMVSDNCTVVMEEFDASRTPLGKIGMDRAEVIAFVKQELGVRTDEILVTKQSSDGALVMTIESETEDTTVRRVMDAIGDAFDRQLSKKRPGVIAVKLEAVTPELMVDLAQERRGEPPTELRRQVSHFLNSRRGTHLVDLGFYSTGSLVRAQDGPTTTNGVSYNFHCDDSPFFSAEVEAALLEIRQPVRRQDGL